MEERRLSILRLFHRGKVIHITLIPDLQVLHLGRRPIYFLASYTAETSDSTELVRGRCGARKRQAASVKNVEGRGRGGSGGRWIGGWRGDNGGNLTDNIFEHFDVRWITLLFS